MLQKYFAEYTRRILLSEPIKSFARNSILSKFIGDFAAILLFGLVILASYYDQIWQKIPIMERFAFVPWILFVFSYYLVSKYEKVHGVKKTINNRSRQNYYYTLYWGIAFLLLHYLYIVFEIFIDLRTNGYTKFIFDFHLGIVEINSNLNFLAPEFYTLLQVLGLGIALYGVIRAASGRIHLNGFWAIDIYDYGESNKLITTGPYENVRHPIYQGQILLVIGTAFVAGDILFYLFSVLVTVLNIARAKTEEQDLEKRFGEEFKKYREDSFHLFRRLY